MTTPGSYRLRSGRLHDVTGPLALLAGQALAAATAGRHVTVSDAHGTTVTVIATGDTARVVPCGPIELFPTEPQQPTAWTARLADLIQQQGETP